MGLLIVDSLLLFLFAFFFWFALTSLLVVAWRARAPTIHLLTHTHPPTHTLRHLHTPADTPVDSAVVSEAHRVSQKDAESCASEMKKEPGNVEGKREGAVEVYSNGKSCQLPLCVRGAASTALRLRFPCAPALPHVPRATPFIDSAVFPSSINSIEKRRKKRESITLWPPCREEYKKKKGVILVLSIIC